MDVTFKFPNEVAVCNVRTLYIISISLFTGITLVNHRIYVSGVQCYNSVSVCSVACSSPNIQFPSIITYLTPFAYLTYPHHLVFPIFCKHKMLFSFMKFVFCSNFDFLEVLCSYEHLHSDSILKYHILNRVIYI